jgi:hypothetical protein
LVIVYKGAGMSLDHLFGEPLIFQCPCEDIGRDLNIRVHFTPHVYTESYDDSIHTPDQIIYSEGKDRHRVFCPIRYKLSLELPELVCDLPKWKVHQTAERRNYVHVVQLEVSNQFYEIYFMLQRAAGGDEVDLRLTVESAYPVEVATPLPKRPRAIRFFVLARKVLRNEPIHFAAR